MIESKELINLDDPKKIFELLTQPGIKLSEFMTGVFASDNYQWKLSVGHLIQASIKGRLFSQLGKEIELYIKKGKIQEDFLDREQSKQSLSELLKFIDKSAPDEDRFKAMKSLFIKSVAQDSSEKEQILSYQFMKICKDLASGDLLILKAAYDINNGNLSQKLTEDEKVVSDPNAQNWLRNISKQIGHEIKSLVEFHEERLVNLKLISPRTHADRSGLEQTDHYRLTELGYKICDYIYRKSG